MESFQYCFIGSFIEYPHRVSSILLYRVSSILLVPSCLTGVGGGDLLSYSTWFAGETTKPPEVENETTINFIVKSRERKGEKNEGRKENREI